MLHLGKDFAVACLGEQAQNAAADRRRGVLQQVV
jgi:hypothetical protein